MLENYDSTAVGVPYIRVGNIAIQYPISGIPQVTISQTTAIRLADNSIIELGYKNSISFSLDMVNNANTPIPLVHPTTGADLGANTTLQQLMLGVLAVVRQQQKLQP